MARSSKKSKYGKDEILILEFDGGEKLEAGIMGAFEVNGVMYAALENLKDGDIYLYRYVENENSFELLDIPDEDYDAVQQQFNAIMNAK